MCICVAAEVYWTTVGDTWSRSCVWLALGGPWRGVQLCALCIKSLIGFGSVLIIFWPCIQCTAIHSAVCGCAWAGHHRLGREWSRCVVYVWRRYCENVSQEAQLQPHLPCSPSCRRWLPVFSEAKGKQYDTYASTTGGKFSCVCLAYSIFVHAVYM